MKNKDLKRRIIEISYKLKLGHLGSCLTAVDIIDEIYKIKKPDEKFVLSAGHAHLAHLVVMEKYYKGTKFSWGVNEVEYLIDKYGIHCDRQSGCDVSTGSLGHGVGIAVGMALADRTKNVYCLLSDGEMAEGSIWEALRIQKEQELSNLKVYVNWNGYAAYKETKELPSIVTDYSINFRLTNMSEYPEYLQGQLAHYKVLNEKEYKNLQTVLQ